MKQVAQRFGRGSELEIEGPPAARAAPGGRDATKAPGAAQAAAEDHGMRTALPAISSRIRSTAAAGSLAPVTGRPMTIRSAPAERASAGVEVRFWSSAVPPSGAKAGRIPGVTMKNSAPQRARTREASRGEQTTPSQPARRARAASLTTSSSAGPSSPIEARSESPRLVNAVTASRRGRFRPPRRASRASDSAAVRIISSPPLACRLIIAAPRRIASTAAAETVVGMS